MSSSGELFRFFLVVLVLLALMQGVAGWTVQNMSITPGQGSISPQTPVTVTYTVHFDAWLTGLTFQSKNTLDMYTDLLNAHWVVTITDIDEDHPPLTSPLVENKGSRVRIDGWTLSYAGKQIELNVRLQGVAPDVDQSQDKTIIRVQEWNANGQPVSGTGMEKKYQIYVPTPTPEPTTPAPTETPTDSVRNLNTPMASVTPTRKQTYTPGPEPLVICGMLAILLIIIAMKRKT